MNISYNRENVLFLAIQKSSFIYPEDIFYQKLLDLKEVFSCKIQDISVNYVSFMNLEGSTFPTGQNKLNIYNINGYLKKQKTYNATDNFICKLLLRLKKKIRSLKLHLKPK